MIFHGRVKLPGGHRRRGLQLVCSLDDDAVVGGLHLTLGTLNSPDDWDERDERIRK